MSKWKRLTAFIMALVLFTGCFQMSAQAETAEEKQITIHFNKKKITDTVLKTSKGKVFVPLSWLEKYGLMKRKESKYGYEFYYADQEKLDNFAKRICIGKEHGTIEVKMFWADSSFFNSIADTSTIWDAVKKSMSDQDKEKAVSNYFTSLENKGQNTRQNLNGKYITIFEDGFSQDLMHYQDDLWVRIEQLLPLMNAECNISDNGILTIKSHPVSILQALYRADLGSVMFDADRDIAGDKVLNGAGIIIDSIMEFRFDRLDIMNNTGCVKDYESIFKDYLMDDQTYLKAYDKDKTPRDRWMEFSVDALDISASSIDIYEGLYGMATEDIGLDPKSYPELATFINTDNGKVYGGKSFKVVHGLADYWYTYEYQIDDHRKMLGAVYDYTLETETSEEEKAKIKKWPSYKAAKNVQKAYGEKFADKLLTATKMGIRDGILEVVKDKAVKVSGAGPWALTFSATKTIMDAFNMGYEVFGEDAVIGLVDNSVDIAYKTYLRRINEMDLYEDSLNELRLSAIMALVSSRHAYQTYWKGKGHTEDVEKIDEMLELFYLAVDGIECDSSLYYYGATEKLKPNVEKLKLSEVEKKDTLLNEDDSLQVSQKLTIDLNTLFDMTPEQMECLEWDYFNIEDIGNCQEVNANVGNFQFTARSFETLDGVQAEYPQVLLALDRYAGEGNVPVVDTLVTGMTYSEVKELVPVITELTSTEMGRHYNTIGAAEAVYYWDMDAVVYCIFDGTGADAVLIGVEVDRTNY